MTSLLGLDRPRRVRTLGGIALVFATLLATQGAIVRATGSGLGCPDWPLCYDSLTPPPENLMAIIEYSHRVIAGIGGLLILAAAAGAIVLGGRRSALRWIGLAVVPLLGAQVLLGAAAVLQELPPWLVTLHLATATSLIGAMAAVTLLAHSRFRESPPEDARLRWMSALTALGAFVLIASGGYTSSSYAGLACPSWPLCNGGILPLQGPQVTHMVHRLIAAAVAYSIVHLALRLWRRRAVYPLAARLALVALAAVAAEVGVGALNALTGVPEAVTAVHSLLAQWVWVATLATAMALRMHGARDPVPEATADAEEPATSGDAPLVALSTWPHAGGRLRFALDFITVTKPRVVLELLITTMAAMLVAARGLPPVSIVLATIGGGALCAGSAAVFNSLYDRDIDRLMERTQRRPLPANRLPTAPTAVWGAVLLVVSLAVLWVGVSGLAAILASVAFGIYVGVYTLGLKRRSPQNIVIGGAAGAIPPLVGWVAGAGSLELPALILFAIVFVWTPPHFWALALVRKREYARAAIPMLPVVRGDESARRHIFVYSLVLVALALALAPINQMGWLYAASALLLGFVFMRRAWTLLRVRTVLVAQRMFRYSITYLTVLFAAMVLDVLLAPYL